MVTVTIAKTDAQLTQILALQRRYLCSVLSREEQDTEGFVYTQHDLPLLRRMASELPQAIAVDAGQVVGYCLALPVSLRLEQPMLEPMFVQFEQCCFASRPLSSYRFFVGGQVCVERGYRGYGLLGLLYHELRRVLSARYELCVTEIATRNRVSLHAHEKIGFQPIATYSDGDEAWVIVAWELADHTSAHGGIARYAQRS